ncbi:MAG TPA: sensor histidine kinase [Acidimicrobiales bacterium]|nr:sensor histidine kinase [Acidimicrobiales bacterium]
MALSPGGVAPRPPFLQRITPTQWLAVDIALSVVFFFGEAVSVILGHNGGGSPDHKAALIVALAFATLPIALRRRYPFPSLVMVTAGLALATVIGNSVAGAPLVAFPLYSVATGYERRDSAKMLVGACLVILVAIGIGAAIRPTSANIDLNSILAGAAAWFVGDSVRARRAYVAGLTQQAEQRQHREIERAQQSIDEERLQIARELHDILAHSLSVIAIQSGVGRHVLDTQPEEARKALAAVETTSRSALDELRRVLGMLRSGDPNGPSFAPAPGLGDLELLLTQCRAAGLEVAYHQHGDIVPMSPGMELSVYRIVQEALTNVTKHAGTAHAAVDITFGNGEVVVRVVDEGALHRNGAVLRPDRGGEGHAHHGIIGMRERTAMFGGSLIAEPRVEGGFEVLARLPLEGESP